jgi:periplasmic divalent cation tolerance protein
MPEALLVLCTVPDEALADTIARALVEERLAACVNRIPGVVSTYRWQGAVQVEAELLLLVKTTAARFDAVRDRIVALHRYELPEVVAVTIDSGLDRYLGWIASETTPAT